MGISIAIDLGTTNSVVAVFGVYPEAGRVVEDGVPPCVPPLVSEERVEVAVASLVPDRVVADPQP